MASSYDLDHHEWKKQEVKWLDVDLQSSPHFFDFWTLLLVHFLFWKTLVHHHKHDNVISPSWHALRDVRAYCRGTNLLLREQNLHSYSWQWSRLLRKLQTNLEEEEKGLRMKDEDEDTIIVIITVNRRRERMKDAEMRILSLLSPLHRTASRSRKPRWLSVDMRIRNVLSSIPLFSRLLIESYPILLAWKLCCFCLAVYRSNPRAKMLQDGRIS